MHDRMSVALQLQPRANAAAPVEVGPIGVQLGPVMSLLRLLE